MKKGSFFDLIYLIVGIMILAICAFVAYQVLSAVDASGTELSNQTISADSNQTYIGQWMGNVAFFDSIFLFIIIGFGIVTMILAATIDVNPAFAFISILVYGVVVVISTVVTNVYAELADSTGFVGIASVFPAMTIILGELPLIMFALSILLAILMYGKSR